MSGKYTYSSSPQLRHESGQYASEPDTPGAPGASKGCTDLIGPLPSCNISGEKKVYKGAKTTAMYRVQDFF